MILIGDRVIPYTELQSALTDKDLVKPRFDTKNYEISIKEYAIFYSIVLNPKHSSGNIWHCNIFKRDLENYKTLGEWWAK